MREGSRRRKALIPMDCGIWSLVPDMHRTATGSVEWLPGAEGMSSLMCAAASATC